MLIVLCLHEDNVCRGTNGACITLLHVALLCLPFPPPFLFPLQSGLQFILQDYICRMWLLHGTAVLFQRFFIMFFGASFDCLKILQSQIAPTSSDLLDVVFLTHHHDTRASHRCYVDFKHWFKPSGRMAGYLWLCWNGEKKASAL